MCVPPWGWSETGGRGVNGAALGVDVVDLEQAHRRGGPTERFLKRVYDERERTLISRRDDRPDLPWILWAAKEAAFKAVTLERGEAPVFAHAEFRVTLARIPDTRATRGEELRGRVTWRGEELVLGGSLSAERAVAWALVDPSLVSIWRWSRIDVEQRRHGEGGVRSVRDADLSPREAAPVHSLSSALVRLAVRRDAAAWLGVDEAGLEVICPPGPRGRVPPELHLQGAPVTDIGITVSHHGRWLAWGVAGPADQRSDGL